MLIVLEREYYSRHRDIYDWVLANVPGPWPLNPHNLVFGYQELHLTQDEYGNFIKWLSPKKNKKNEPIGITIISEES